MEEARALAVDAVLGIPDANDVLARLPTSTVVPEVGAQWCAMLDVLELAALWSDTIATAETFASLAWLRACTMPDLEETLSGLPTPGEFVGLLSAAHSVDRCRHMDRTHFVARLWTMKGGASTMAKKSSTYRYTGKCNTFRAMEF